MNTEKVLENNSIINRRMILQINKQKALDAISSLRSRIPFLKTKEEGSLDFQSWKSEANDTIKLIFGDDSSFYTNFHEVLYPKFCGAFLGRNERIDYKARYLRELDSLDSKLGSLQNVVDLSEDNNQIQMSSVQTIMCVLERFHRFARQLKVRHQTRPTITINDEYDVQDLVHAILKLFFNDVRAEEYTPSYAGGSSRIDFLIKSENIGIEIKKTRANLRDKELGEQLIIDKERYKSHHNCKTLICFVYDPEELIINPEGLASDLAEKSEEMSVFVVISPKI